VESHAVKSSSFSDGTFLYHFQSSLFAARAQQPAADLDATVSAGAPWLMFLGLHDISEDGLFAQRLAGFQAVQTVHEDKTIAVAPHQDGGLLSALQHALGNLQDYFRLERRTTFDRNIDTCDFEFLALHHGPTRSRDESPPLAAPAESSHNGCMIKTRVEFKYKRIEAKSACAQGPTLTPLVQFMSARAGPNHKTN
jgi:hypothetical protein